MSLYLKNERNEAQSEAETSVSKLQNREKNIRKENLLKERLTAIFRNGRRAASGYMGRVYSVVGVLCVLAVILIVAANRNMLADAEEATMPSWTDEKVQYLANCTFTTGVGGVTKLGDLKLLEVKDVTNPMGSTKDTFIVTVGITDTNQLKAVLGGLSSSYTGEGDSTCYRNKVVFKLLKDITLDGGAPQVFEDKYNDIDTGALFQDAVFDGNGHTITCKNFSISMNGEDVDTSDSQSENQDSYEYTGKYTGMLFGKVYNSEIKNIFVSVINGTINYEYGQTTQGTFGNREIDYGYASYYLDVGGVCGYAENSKFSDIEVSGDWKVIISPTHQKVLREYDFGLGGIAGAVSSGVTITRCQDSSSVKADFDFGDGFFTSYGIEPRFMCVRGGMVGHVLGNNNVIQSCWGKGTFSYTSNKESFKEGEGSTTRSNFLYITSACIIGILDENASVDMTYSAGSNIQKMVGARLLFNNSGSHTFGQFTTDSNCYSAEGTWILYTYERDNNDFRKPYLDAYQPQTMNYTPLSARKERINNTDWGYNENGEHYLIHPTSLPYIINFNGITIGEPYGESHAVDVTGSVCLLDSTNNFEKSPFPEGSRVYLYFTVDGTDPAEDAVAKKWIQADNLEDVVLTDFATFSDTSKALTIRAKMKVVFNESTDSNAEVNEFVWWSPACQKTIPVSTLYIGKPTLAASVENQAFEDIQESTAYPLGTTKLQLTRSGMTEYEMFYDFRSEGGLKLVYNSSEEGINLDSMLHAHKYTEPFTLTEELIDETTSNKTYLYVLGHIKKDEQDYYNLFEYELVVFSKDKLISVTPVSGNRVPNNSDITIRVGSGKENEYPYDKINILVTDEQSRYTTLEGQRDVQTYQGAEYKKGSGTAEDPWQLVVNASLSGEPGQTFYIYAEPYVSTGYERMYGRFVIEYSYTIMEKASDLELDPSTITMAESGSSTGIPINEKIYMNSRGSSDIIVYSKTIVNLETEMVKDTATLRMLEGAAVTSVGENAYYWASDRSVLYVRSADLWYSIYNLDGTLEVYGESNLSFESSYAGKYAYVTVMLFSAGYDPSDSVTYRYQVNVQDAVAAPTALLADGSNINMNTTLFFNCEQGCVIYYTTDGKEPQLIVADDGQITPKVGTYRYQPMDGIPVTPENGFVYGKDTVIKLIAYPVTDASSDSPVYNDDYKESELSTFTYKIREQLQVDTPLAYPETEKDKMTVVVKGDSISLSCATSGADIYCTVNGSTPQVDDAYKYQGVLKVEGDYGGYFTVKVMAAKDGFKNSEVATYVYKIADKDTVSSVTAIPSTSGQVIAGDRIILSTTESGADIYYTIDGNTPDVAEYTDENGLFSHVTSPATKHYDPSASIIVPEGSGYFVVQAIAVKYGMTNSPVTQFVYAYADSVGIPYGNPSSGTVTENTQVILRCAQEEAIIYYEVAYDGKEPAEPTTSSAVFSEQAPIVITRNTKIKAFTVYNRQSSPVVTLSYTLAQKMAAPTASVSSGSIVPSGTTVILSSGGGKVYYTTDGSDPMDSNNTAVNIGSSVVITGKAEEKVVVKACTKQSEATTSEMVTFTYQISRYPGGVITDTATGSTLPGGTSVHLMTDVTGGTIYYTTGSGSPITSGIAGNSVVLNGEAGSNITVKAVAIAPNTGMTGSYASFDYVLMEQLAAPHASVRDGSVLTEKTSIVLKANKGKIYFTIDGTNPTRASDEYTKPIIVSEAVTIKAIAIEEGSVSSEISTFSYTFAPKAGEITASLPAGVVDAGAVVRLSCSTPDTVIYYTTDGTDPSRSADEGVFVYDDKEGIEIHRSVTVKAVARRGNMCDSSILTLSYQVDEIPIEIEKDKIAQQEAEEGLKPTDTSNLESRHTQPMKESESDVKLNDFLSAIEIRGDESILPVNATFRGKEVSISQRAEAEAKKLLGDDYELVQNFSFAVYSNGEQIYPEGQIEIGIPIPKEYENADITIVSINENNGVKVYNSRREEGYVYTEVPYLNNFALAVAEKNGNSRSRINLIPLMSVAAGSLVCVGIVMIIRTVRRRKRY